MNKPSTLKFILGFIWSSPLTLFGLLLAVIYMKGAVWKLPAATWWSEGCVEIIPEWILFNPGAQTFGIIIFYRNEKKRADKGLRVHERVHVDQAFRGGVFYAAAYLCDFLRIFFFKCPSVSELNFTHKRTYTQREFPADLPRWKRAYLMIIFERFAYRWQHLFENGDLAPGTWGSA